MSETKTTPPAPVQAPAQVGAGATRTPTQGSAIVSPGHFQLRSMKDRRQERRLKALIYGGPGVGKTTLAGSSTNLDRMKDVILLSAEQGDIVFDDNERVDDPDNIDMLHVERVEQLEKVYEFLRTHVMIRNRGDTASLEKLQTQVGLSSDRLRKYQTVIVDSLTDIEAMNLASVMGLDAKGFEMGDIDVADWGVFRKNNVTIQNLVRAIRNLDLNVILICGERSYQDDRKVQHISPWMTGQLMRQIQSLVDFVGYQVISQDPAVPARTRRLYIEPPANGPKFDAKCRRASIKKTYYDNPVMADIMADFGYVSKEMT